MPQAVKKILNDAMTRVGYRTLRRLVPRTRRRWRLEIVNENTLFTVWSLRLPELRAWIAGGVLLAAIASLVILLLLFTPVGQSLRGHLPGALRSQYLDLALQVDSLNDVARVQRQYSDNIVAILNGTAVDSVAGTAAESPLLADSLLPASEAEKMFVRQFESRERFNISVLSPIAAEGMIFEAPTREEDGSGPVAAIYSGTVVALSYDSRGLATVTIQHPNDFISIYGAMKDVYVDKGSTVVPAQRIGASTSSQPLQFELWRAGSRLEPSKYVNYPDKI